MDHNADAPTLFGDSEVLPHYEGWLGSLIHIEPLFVEKLAVVGLLVDAAATAVGEAAQIDPTLVVGFDHACSSFHGTENYESVLNGIVLTLLDQVDVLLGFAQNLSLGLIDAILKLSILLWLLFNVPLLRAIALTLFRQCLDSQQNIILLEVFLRKMDANDLGRVNFCCFSVLWFLLVLVDFILFVDHLA